MFSRRRLITTASRLANGPLYLNHVPTSPLQRLVLTVGSAIGGVINPERSDLVFTFGEVTGWYALKFMHSRMLKDAIGQEILKMKPRIRESNIHFDRLRQLPQGTLGREYVRFMDHYGYTPDGRADVKYVDDPELAYVMQRYRELHDFVHTLLRVPTSVYGEIVVKQFEAVQTGLPLCTLGGLVAPVKLSYQDQIEMLTTYTPWALRNGLQSPFFMNIHFEKHLEEPIKKLQETLNIVPLPEGSLKLSNVWNY